MIADSFARFCLSSTTPAPSLTHSEATHPLYSTTPATSSQITFWSCLMKINVRLNFVQDVCHFVFTDWAIIRIAHKCLHLSLFTYLENKKDHRTFLTVFFSKYWILLHVHNNITSGLILAGLSWRAAFFSWTILLVKRRREIPSFQIVYSARFTCFHPPQSFVSTVRLQAIRRSRVKAAFRTFLKQSALCERLGDTLR